MSWQETLQESFDQVTAVGGLYALDVDEYVERQGRRRVWRYRIRWSNRITSMTSVHGRLLIGEGGVIRTGLAKLLVEAVAEVLEQLGHLRCRKRSRRRAA